MELEAGITAIDGFSMLPAAFPSRMQVFKVHIRKNEVRTLRVVSNNFREQPGFRKQIIHVFFIRIGFLVVVKQVISKVFEIKIFY